jgi:hypothetical protein
MIAEALARVSKRPWLIVALAGLNLGIALLATLPFSAALEPILDARPAAAGLLTGDDGIFRELFADNAAVGSVAGAGAQLAVLVYGLLAWLLAGGILATLAQPGALGPREGAGGLLAASASHGWRMLKIGGAGLLLRLVPIGLATGLYFAGKPLVAHRGLREIGLWMALLALAFAWSWSLATVAVDYARALLIAHPHLGIFRALGRGLKLAWRRRGATAALAAFSVATFLAVTLLYHAIAYALPNPPLWSFALVIVLRVATALARAFFSTTTLVAAGLLTTRSTS